MAITPYDRITNLQNDQALAPTDPYPAPKLDQEYNALKITTDDLIQHLDIIQRDDGQLENESVGRDQLKDDVYIGFGAPAPWDADHDYVVADTVFQDNAFWYCEVTHTSTNFPADLAAGYWTLIADFTSAATVGATMYVGDFPPAVPTQGQQWFESDTGNTYLYYDDGSSAQWIHTNGAVTDVIEEAPIDGQRYERKDAGWVLSGGSVATAVLVARVVSTGAQSPAADFEQGDTIDGVTLVTGDVVLRVSTTSPELNGAYVVPASGAAARHSAFGAYDTHCGALFSVQSGTINADTLWQCTSDHGGTLGTTPIVISEITGARSFSRSKLFTGSGLPAQMWFDVNRSAAHATEPEIGAQFSLAASGGLANQDTAYKIALTTSVVATAGAADIYGVNNIVQGYGGAGGHLITAIENDLNNMGADAVTIGAPTSCYGMVNVAAGTAKSTAAYWATAVAPGRWEHGFAAANTSGSAIGHSTFYDASLSSNILYSATVHDIGINLFGAGCTSGHAFLAPNNAGYSSANGVFGAALNLLKLDAANIAQYGEAAIAGHKFTTNPDVGAAVHIKNAHATSADVGMTIEVGSTASTDASTFIYFVNQNIANLCGSIGRTGAGFNVSYGTASDARLKENVRDLSPSLGVVQQMQPRLFNWIGDTAQTECVGFIAQELVEVYPDAVKVGGDDAAKQPWQVDYAKLTPILVSALQEATATIQALAKRVEALEARRGVA